MGRADGNKACNKAAVVSFWGNLERALESAVAAAAVVVGLAEFDLADDDDAPAVTAGWERQLPISVESSSKNKTNDERRRDGCQKPEGEGFVEWVFSVTLRQAYYSRPFQGRRKFGVGCTERTSQIKGTTRHHPKERDTRSAIFSQAD